MERSLHLCNKNVSTKSIHLLCHEFSFYLFLYQEKVIKFNTTVEIWYKTVVKIPRFAQFLVRDISRIIHSAYHCLSKY